MEGKKLSNFKSGCLFVCLFFGLFFWLLSGGDEQSNQNNAWYIGKNLTQSSGLDWQSASEKDKLATCAEIIAIFWENKRLTDDVLSRFSNMDEVKPLAMHLKNNLDVAFSKFDDPVENEKMLSNQKVGEVAVVLMTIDGWLK